mgnify:CR=1 FL=1
MSSQFITPSILQNSVKSFSKLLWENPDLNKSTFNGGTYSVNNINNYSLFLLKYKIAYSINDNQHGNINFNGNQYQLMSEGNTFIFGADDSLYYRNVGIDTSAKTITFSLCSYCQSWNYMTNQILNTRLFPIALYGIA